MKKFIFLDIDGVLNSGSWAKYCFDNQYEHPELDPECDPKAVAELNRIIDTTGAEIVLSSSWRFGDISNIEKFGIHNWNGKTIDTNIYENRTSCIARGAIIQKYLTKLKFDRELSPDERFESFVHPERWINYVILDDDCDMLVTQINNFVQTNSFEGLTPRLADSAIEILNIPVKS